MPQQNYLIVSMHNTASYVDKKTLNHAIKKFENNPENNTSSTLIFQNQSQLFFANRKTGFVINPDAIDIHFGGTYQGCPTLGKMPTLKRKEDFKINSNNPNKLVYKLTEQTITDYTRYNRNTKEVYKERSNEKALQLYTETIKYKNSKKGKVAECGELLVSKRKNFTRSGVLGLIIDISEEVPDKVKDLKEILHVNPNFKLYIFNKGKINVIENNKKNFLDKLAKYTDSYAQSSCFPPFKKREPVEDVIDKNSVSLTKHKFNLNIENILNPPTPNSLFSSPTPESENSKAMRSRSLFIG